MGPDRESKQLVLSKRFERHRLAAQTIYILLYIHKTFEKTLHTQTCGVSPEAKLSDVSECCNASLLSGLSCEHAMGFSTLYLVVLTSTAYSKT